ncbi:DUF6415 family natural product biosynthesis protein [Streptomyces sp. N2-109]|uniref:DUF6415 family natural product biosynthesis protein n=1 Tax=Streptomyces gossypii TaxID=2883101 RepID=A0ABT2K0G2_9ACTN|nr:DUF6415 family natural product biosynthesis protein [Streptomyces gossypii]MCT2593633.1 DUF6415 family natural product biosynthesis protein [Streptomyces gossypii]
MRAAIARAQEILALPGRPDLAPIEAELRGYAEALLPVAEAGTAKLWRGSLKWWQRRSRLDIVHRTLAQPPPTDPLAAHAHLFHLTADCRVLLNQLAGEEW